MNQQEWIKKLEQEGFTSIRVCPIPPNQDLPEHTHDEHTVHIILDGKLTITDSTGTKIFRTDTELIFRPALPIRHEAQPTTA